MDQAAVDLRTTFNFAHINIDTILQKSLHRNLSIYSRLQIDRLRQAIYDNATVSIDFPRSALESEVAKKESDKLSTIFA